MGKVCLNGSLINVSGRNSGAAISSSIFQEWFASLDSQFKVRSIIFQSVDFAGRPSQRRVIFLKFKADVTDEHGNELPGIVFMRGGAVAILVILRCEEEEYVVLTLQPRFAAGHFAFPEIPAGMLDGDGNFSGVAARELAEETGIKIRAGDLLDMTELVYGGRWRGVYPSAGACEEFLRFFLYRRDVTREELDDISARCTGLREDGELITLAVAPIEDVFLETPDAKALSALFLYNALNMRADLIVKKLKDIGLQVVVPSPRRPKIGGVIIERSGCCDAPIEPSKGGVVMYRCSACGKSIKPPIVYR